MSREPCPTCHNEGVVERLATPDEVDEGCELGIAFDPCPNDAWHNRKSSRRDEIRTRCDNATPGPWQLDGPWWYDFVRDDPESAESAACLTVGELRVLVTALPKCEPVDADFLAHARSDVPYLLDLVDQLGNALHTWTELKTHGFPDSDCPTCDALRAFDEFSGQGERTVTHHEASGGLARFTRAC